MSAGSSQEIFSFSFGGSSDNLLAAGSKSQVLLFELVISSFGVLLF